MNRFSKPKLYPSAWSLFLKYSQSQISAPGLDILIKYIQFLYKEKKKSVTPGDHYRRTLIVIIDQVLSLAAWEQPPSRRDG